MCPDSIDSMCPDSITDWNEMILTDDLSHKALCFYGRSGWKEIVRILLTDGTSAVVLFRLAKFFQKIQMGFLALIVLEMNKFLNGCVIGRGAEFGKGLVLMHPVGVIINSEVRAGENIVLESGVVIGAARNGIPVNAPRLGNNIFIGAGAKILGGIRVGSNVKVGANAVVIDDVPDGATVVGIPARVVRREGKGES